jgi:hypothetical protein
MYDDSVLKNRIVITIITIKPHSEKAFNVGCGTIYPEDRQRVYEINPLNSLALKIHYIITLRQIFVRSTRY